MPTPTQHNEFNFLVEKLDRETLLNLATEFGVPGAPAENMTEDELRHALLLFAGVA
jgi:hypothetical protein